MAQGRIEIEDKIEIGVQEKLEKFPPFVEEWYYALRARGNTVKSCRDYINKLEHFFSVMEYDLLNLDVDDITANDLVKYFTIIQYKEDKDGNKTKTSGSYLNSVWFALNNFFEYQYELGRISKNYMGTVKPAKSKGNITSGQPTNLLTANDFKKMLCHIPGDTIEIIKRNKAILMLYMTTGMRRDALCQINIADINGNALTVVDKGEKTHKYVLTPETINAIDEWLNERKYIRKAVPDALFVTYQGKRMTGNAIYTMVSKCAQTALGKSIGPHKLRSGLCSILYEETHDIEFVRRAIGHSNVSTTQRYIATEGDERETASQIMSKLL